MPQIELTQKAELAEPSDADAIAAVKLLASNLKIDDEHWSTIVCGVLLAYLERRNGLPEWWIWTRFACVFGKLPNGGGYGTWEANDTLTDLLQCLQALNAYHASGWWQRLRAWRIRRVVYRKLLRIGAGLQHNADHWWDRYDFAKYCKQARP